MPELDPSGSIPSSVVPDLLPVKTLLLIRAMPYESVTALRPAILERWPRENFIVLDQERRYWKTAAWPRVKEIVSLSEMPEPLSMTDLARRRPWLGDSVDAGTLILAPSESIVGISNLIEIGIRCGTEIKTLKYPVWMMGPSGRIRRVGRFMMLGAAGLEDAGNCVRHLFLAAGVLTLLPVCAAAALLRGKVHRGPEAPPPPRSWEDGTTVVIPSFNTRDLLRRCLGSLREKSPEVKIIVVENGSSDDSAAMVRREFPGVELIEMGRNAGFAAACNAGLREVKTKYAVLMNSDTVVNRDPFEPMRRHLEAHPDCGAVTCPVVNEGGGVYKNLCRGEYGWGSLLDRSFLSVAWGGTRWHRRLLRKVLVIEESAYDRPHDDLASFSFAVGMFRTADLFAAGLLDERFFMYFDDPDLCLRLRQSGKTIAYIPEGEIVHTGKGGRSDPSVPFIQYCRSRMLFLRKHGPFLALPFAAALSIMGVMWNCMTRSSRWKPSALDRIVRAVL